MLKIGSTEVAIVVAKGARALREMVEKNASLADENQQLRAELLTLRHEQEIAKIASEMEERGLNAHLTLDEKIAALRVHQSLDHVKEAMSMVQSTTTMSFGKASEMPGRGSLDSLTSFCLGGE
jgi:hypothetical protein